MGSYRWSAWAKNVERPDEMLEFVDAKLWRYLQTFGVNKGSKEFADDPVAERFRPASSHRSATTLAGARALRAWFSR